MEFGSIFNASSDRGHDRMNALRENLIPGAFVFLVLKVDTVEIFF